MSFVSNPPGFEPIVISDFANLPLAASNNGLICRVNGLGIAGFSHWVSTGVFWKPWPSSVILGSASGTLSAPIASLPNSNNIPTYFTLPHDLTIPENAIYPGCFIEIYAAIYGIRAGAANIFPVVSLSLGVDNSIDRYMWRSAGVSQGVTYMFPFSFPNALKSNRRSAATHRFHSTTGVNALSTVSPISNDTENTRIMIGCFSGAGAVSDSYHLLNYTALLR